MKMITRDLEQMLREEEFNEKLIAENKAPKVYTVIEKYMEEKNIQRTDIIRFLNLDRTYGYQILNGTRTPTRVHLIKIGLLLKLSLEEMQRLLKIGGKEILYARNMTDAKAIYAIEHNLGYEEACEFIWEEK
ncbi:MAG: hypothetical protein ACI4J6_03105 [Oscillospiraceae bacterium]